MQVLGLRSGNFIFDAFCFGKKFLVFNLISRNIKIKYRRSVLGVFWTLISPIAFATIYYFVFKVILNIQIANYPLFVLVGVLPWGFFSQSLLEGMESIILNWDLISKISVPNHIFSLVASATNFITLAFSIPVMIGLSFLSDVPFCAGFFLLPFYFFALFLITYFSSFILAVAYVFLRDLRHLMGLVINIWFYATPVVYDERMIPAKYAFILDLNPVARIFTGLHEVLVRGHTPEPRTLVPIILWVLISGVFAKIIMNRLGASLVERI